MSDWLLFCKASIVGMIAIMVIWFVAEARTWQPPDQTGRDAQNHVVGPSAETSNSKKAS